jgi:hypothetical protein
MITVHIRSFVAPPRDTPYVIKSHQSAREPRSNLSRSWNGRGLDVNYLSFASSLSWPGQQCEGARDSSGFYRSYLFTFGSCGSTRNGTAAIAYDAALVLRVAIERARQDTDTPPSSDLILSKINEMTVGNGVTGASGSFEITKQYEQGRVPVNKAIVVLNSKGGNSPTAVLLCGRLDTADPPADPGCPTDLGR